MPYHYPESVQVPAQPVLSGSALEYPFTYYSLAMSKLTGFDPKEILQGLQLDARPRTRPAPPAFSWLAARVRAERLNLEGSHGLGSDHPATQETHMALDPGYTPNTYRGDDHFAPPNLHVSEVLEPQAAPVYAAQLHDFAAEVVMRNAYGDEPRNWRHFWSVDEGQLTIALAADFLTRLPERPISPTAKTGMSEVLAYLLNHIHAYFNTIMPMGVPHFDWVSHVNRVLFVHPHNDTLARVLRECSKVVFETQAFSHTRVEWEGYSHVLGGWALSLPLAVPQYEVNAVSMQLTRHSTTGSVVTLSCAQTQRPQGGRVHIGTRVLDQDAANPKLVLRVSAEHGDEPGGHPLANSATANAMPLVQRLTHFVSALSLALNESATLLKGSPLFKDKTFKSLEFSVDKHLQPILEAFLVKNKTEEMLARFNDRE